MLLFELIEETVQSGTVALVLRTFGCAPIDGGLGLGLFHDLTLFIGFALGGLALGLACGVTRFIGDLDPEDKGAQHQKNQYGIHWQLPLPQLLYSGSYLRRIVVGYCWFSRWLAGVTPGLMAQVSSRHTPGCALSFWRL